jgi:hypothetical protein
VRRSIRHRVLAFVSQLRTLSTPALAMTHGLVLARLAHEHGNDPSVCTCSRLIIALRREIH